MPSTKALFNRDAFIQVIEGVAVPLQLAYGRITVKAIEFLQVWAEPYERRGDFLFIDALI